MPCDLKLGKSCKRIHQKRRAVGCASIVQKDNMVVTSSSNGHPTPWIHRRPLFSWLQIVVKMGRREWMLTLASEHFFQPFFFFVFLKTCFVAVCSCGCCAFFVPETCRISGIVPHFDYQDPVNNSYMLVSVEPPELARLQRTAVEVHLCGESSKTCLCRQSFWYLMGQKSCRDDVSQIYDDVWDW